MIIINDDENDNNFLIECSTLRQSYIFYILHGSL